MLLAQMHVQRRGFCSPDMAGLLPRRGGAVLAGGAGVPLGPPLRLLPAWLAGAACSAAESCVWLASIKPLASQVCVLGWCAEAS